MIVYLGAPIDLSKGDPDVVFTELLDALTKANRRQKTELPIAVFRPNRAWFLNTSINCPEDARSIKAINDEAITHSDLCIFCLNDSPSYGVPIEIELSIEEGIQTVVYCPYKVPGYLMVHSDLECVQICRTKDELDDAVGQVLVQFGSLSSGGVA
jgi:hypothetical protein